MKASALPRKELFKILSEQGVSLDGNALYVRRVGTAGIDVSGENKYAYYCAVTDIVTAGIGAPERFVLSEHLKVCIYNYMYDAWLDLQFCCQFFDCYKSYYIKVLALTKEETGIELEDNNFKRMLERNKDIPPPPMPPKNISIKENQPPLSRLEQMKAIMAELQALKGK